MQETIPNEDYKSLLQSSLTPYNPKEFNKLFESHAPEVINSKKQPKTQTIEVRHEQQGFRSSILAAYSNTCCITGCSVTPALEAAHIMDYSKSKDNNINNGICIRADIHILFDRGLLKINDDYEVIVNEELNETQYWDYHGQKISLPKAQIDWPKSKNLKWKFNNH